MCSVFDEDDLKHLAPPSVCLGTVAAMFVIALLLVIPLTADDKPDWVAVSPCFVTEVDQGSPNCRRCPNTCRLRFRVPDWNCTYREINPVTVTYTGGFYGGEIEVEGYSTVDVCVEHYSDLIGPEGSSWETVCYAKPLTAETSVCELTISREDPGWRPYPGIIAASAVAVVFCSLPCIVFACIPAYRWVQQRRGRGRTRGPVPLTDAEIEAWNNEAAGRGNGEVKTAAQRDAEAKAEAEAEARMAAVMGGGWTEKQNRERKAKIKKNGKGKGKGKSKGKAKNKAMGKAKEAASMSASATYTSYSATETYETSQSSV